MLRMEVPRTLSIISVVLLFQSCEGPKHSSEPVLIDREVIDTRIDTFLEKLEKEEHFTGVVLVMRKEEVVHAKGYGMANSERENSVTTAFHIASITKQFTATAILQLVEQGKVDLSNSINTYLPQVYRSPNWDSVNIHHLLTHTSGIPDYGITRDYYDVVNGFCLGNTVHDMVKEAMDKDLEFRPGSRFVYSNIGYTLLGFIITNQTKTPYDKYLRTNILEPMGMMSSKIHVVGYSPTIDEAEGYRWSIEKSTHVPDDVVSLPVTDPDGGLVTTLTDFTKWCGIYMGKKQAILDQKSVDMMTSSYISIDRDGIGGEPRSYGYGLVITKDLISHGGYIVGFRSYFVVDKKNEILMAVFSNNTATDPKRISSLLLKFLETSESLKQ